MATRRIPDKTSERYPFGPRPISTLLPSCTRQAFRARSPLAQRLLLDWPLIVGSTIAEMAVPKRLARGILTLVCNGPAAVEIQYGAPKLMERINTYFGRALVTALSLRQGIVPINLAPPPEEPRPSAAPANQERLVGLPEGELRAALTRLGATLAAQGPRPKSSP